MPDIAVMLREAGAKVTPLGRKARDLDRIYGVHWKKLAKYNSLHLALDAYVCDEEKWIKLVWYILTFIKPDDLAVEISKDKLHKVSLGNEMKFLYSEKTRSVLVKILEEKGIHLKDLN